MGVIEHGSCSGEGSCRLLQLIGVSTDSICKSLRFGVTSCLMYVVTQFV